MEALTDMINQRYMEDLGAFIIKDNNGNYKYGNIISEKTLEFANYKFRQGHFVNGKLQLEFIDLVNNSIEMVEVEVDSVNNQFSVMPKVMPSEPVSLNVSEIKAKIEAEIAMAEQFGDEKWSNVLKDAYECYDETTNTVDVAKVEKIIENSGYDNPADIDVLRSTLQLDSLDQSLNEDVCVNPIKIAFK